MTSISPWFRGYRRALRDIQHGIDQHVHSSNGSKKTSILWLRVRSQYLCGI